MRRRESSRIGAAVRRSSPKASRRRRAGSTVIIPVARPSRAAAIPRAAATVVLPTPPGPSRMMVEPCLEQFLHRSCEIGPSGAMRSRQDSISM